MADIVFSNIRVIDGSGAPAFAGEVRVHGNRIREIARDGAKLSRDGAEMVDGGGSTLMPGLIEAHGHLSFGDGPNLECLGVIPPEEHLLLTLKNARKMLDAGFTSVCSAASAKARLDVVAKRAIDAGDFPGPRTLAASPELTVTGGLGDVRLSHVHRDSFGIICDGPDEFRRVAREMVREGVDTLKINPSGDEFVPHARANMTVMTEAEVAAVCDVAQALGKRVAAHARSAGAVKLCVKHGVQIVYHATLCDDEALAALESARDWVFVAPTLGITHATLYDATPWGITTEVATSLGMKRELDIAVANMRELVKRGVRVLPGGDYGFAWNPIGADARDLEHFVNYLGFTPMEAIVSATRQGAEIMMQPNELGQVMEGYLADLILVDGDPVADIRVLQDKARITGVMKDGEFWKRPGARKAKAVAAE